MRALLAFSPLTLTLSPEGRGDTGAGAKGPDGTAGTEPTPPLRGERLPRTSSGVGPKDRVRGKKALHSQIGRARWLRRDETDAERLLWSRLRNRQLNGHKFVRQLPVGRYFADSACRERMLIIEVDGGQHDESRADAVRTAALNAAGYSVLRFWNNEVLGNLAGLLDAISRVLEGSPSPDLRFAPATLSPEGRGMTAAGPASTSPQRKESLPRTRSGGAAQRRALESFPNKNNG